MAMLARNVLMTRIPFVLSPVRENVVPAGPAAMQKFFNRVTLEARDRHLTKNKFIVGSACGIASRTSSFPVPEP
jgi:hypothetical protein